MLFLLVSGTGPPGYFEDWVIFIFHTKTGTIWRLWYQKQVSQAGISNCIPQNTVGCNYVSLPEIPASGTKSLISSVMTKAPTCPWGQTRLPSCYWGWHYAFLDLTPLSAPGCGLLLSGKGTDTCTNLFVRKTLHRWFNTLRPRQNGRHLPNNIFKCIFLNVNAWIANKISLKFVP